MPVYGFSAPGIPCESRTGFAHHRVSGTYFYNLHIYISLSKGIIMVFRVRKHLGSESQVLALLYKYQNRMGMGGSAEWSSLQNGLGTIAYATW